MHDKTKCVLVADDDDGVREVLRLGLTALLDVVIVEARDGEEALRLATEVRPDVIILDLDMPLVHGLEVARRLRADPRTQAISILALSGNERRPIALDAGCDEFFVKPFSLHRVAEWVRRRLGRSVNERACRYEVGSPRVQAVGAASAAVVAPALAVG